MSLPRTEAEWIMAPGARALLWLFALLSSANALWMLLHAWSWFDWLPGVSDTGVANAHFIHDVGIVYLLSAAGFIWCIRHPARGYPLLVGISLFFIGHALGHVIEIVLGQLPASHWFIDLPLVFGPALMLGIMVWPSVWSRLCHTPANEAATSP